MKPTIVRTLDLTEAADFLKMTREGLRRKAARGEIPGGKPGKRWCFREDDLAEYLRSLYPTPAKLSVTTLHPSINGDYPVTFPLRVTP
jgi:excisionase family DNA binding protein